MTSGLRKVGLVAVALLVACAVLPASAGNELAIGAYTSLTVEGFDIDVDSIAPQNFDGDADAIYFGGGFTLDTAVRGDAVFNYRLNAGFDLAGADVDYDVGGSDDLGLFGFVVDNDFGFRVFSNDDIRLWAGPTVRLGLFAGEFDDDANLFNDDEVDLAAVVFGVGGIFGANFSMGDTFTLSVSGGLRADFYTGEVEDNFGVDRDFDADGIGVFVRVGFLWRLP